MGCHFLPQEIFPTQGSNPGLLHCRQIVYQLSYKGSQMQTIEAGYSAFLVSKPTVKLNVAPSSLILCQAPLSMRVSGKNAAVSRHSLLQGIFLTQGSNPGLLHCRQILYRLSHQGSHRPSVEPDPLSFFLLCSPHFYSFCCRTVCLFLS